MNIELHEITVEKLFDGFLDNAEAGVVAYSGKLDIRPPYQREFIYKDKQRNAVIPPLDKRKVFQQALRKPLFYPLNYGNRNICRKNKRIE